MIDWKAKLSSRKFWALVAAFITSLLVIFDVDAEVTKQITALILQGAAVIIYILSEGNIDAKKAEQHIYIIEDTEEAEDTNEFD